MREGDRISQPLTDIDGARGIIVAARSVDEHTVIVFDGGEWVHFVWTDDGVALSGERPPWPDLDRFLEARTGDAFHIKAQCLLVNRVLVIRAMNPTDRPLRASDIVYPSPFMICAAEVPVLHELVRSLPPDPIIVNIGAWQGTSTLAMLEERWDAFIFSIDIEPMPWEAEHLRLAGLWDLHRVVRVLGRSQEAVKHWPRQPQIDMVFIDGGHSREDCRGDFAWIPLVKSGGVIAVHDYHQWHTPEVTLAVDELLMPKYQQIAHVEFLIAFRQP